MKRFSLGLDFGTESVRALLLDLQTGEEVAIAGTDYASGVISERLPGGDAVALDRDWFLQDPDDYLVALTAAVRGVLRETGIEGEEVVGIGLDFTSCTVLPCRADGRPLCKLPELRDNPHAWVKLWKHHGAAEEAAEVLAVAEERGERFLDYYAHRISSEWLIPKALETLRHAPQVYSAADVFAEAADWVVWQLTANLVRNACCAGYKAQYVSDLGWPSDDFLAELDPALSGLFSEKLPGRVVAPGVCVGELRDDWAERLGLAAGTRIGAAAIDAHASVPGCGVVEPNVMAVVMGTSFCHMLLADRLQFFEGVAGVVEDGILPGYYGYESGQTSGGDVFAWFVENCAPASYAAEAELQGISLHELLSRRASDLQPGESGLVALDWWNGNRSVLMDPHLSGAIVGLTLDSLPEEIYRACVEAVMFGTRRIVDAYRDAGVAVDRFVACGGIPQRNPMAMQILSDVLDAPVEVAASGQTAALGSALMGAAAAGEEKGGYASVRQAADALVAAPSQVYRPHAQCAEAYRRLYGEYLVLHDYFGRTERVMHRLRGGR